jgi:uncharacterized membrane protein YkvA (DUF1232 family)
MDFIFSPSFLLFFIKNTIFLKGALVVILYFMLPYDIIPASLFGTIGYVDNAAVFIAVGLFAVGKIGLIYLRSRG